MLRFLLNVNNRLYVHFFFWIGYYLQRVFFYIERYPNSHIVQLIETLGRMPIVYLNLYLLMPLFLKRKQNFLYSISLSISLALGTMFMLEIIGLMTRVEAIHYDLNGQALYSPRRVTNQLFHLITIVIITTIIKVLKDSYQTQQINQALVQEKLETELKFLKSQVNPHFLFNTLNNLYSLILMKSDKAGQTVLKLADIMSYMLHETQHNQVGLQREVQHIQDYIDLEKLRFGDELHLSFSFEGDFQEAYIAPMLLLPFVENAFKHSVTDDETPIHIHIQGDYQAGVLRFEVKNSVAPYTPELANKIKSSGIGLKNVQRRLELLYPQKYHLDLKKEENFFLVKLALSLNTFKHDKNTLPHH